MKQLLRRRSFPFLILLSGYLGSLLVLLFWPLEFFIPFHVENNGVEWIPDSPGVVFPSVGILRTRSAPTRLYDCMQRGKGFTLETWAMTSNNRQRGPTRIVSCSTDKFTRNFTLGQEGADLVLRLRTTQTDKNGTQPQMILPNVFQPNQLQHLVCTYDLREPAFYVDGRRLTHADSPKGDLSSWDPTFPLMLGNEASGARGWLGKLYLVAIYNRALSTEEVSTHYNAGPLLRPEPGDLTCGAHGLVALYSFSAGKGDSIFDRSDNSPPLDLYRPEEIDVNEKILFQPPYSRIFYRLAHASYSSMLRSLTVKEVAEFIGNIILFIPFGMFLWRLHRDGSQRFLGCLNSTLFVIGLGIVLIFLTEFVQYFMKSRVSTLTDAANNLIGLILGLLIERRYRVLGRLRGTSS